MDIEKAITLITSMHSDYTREQAELQLLRSLINLESDPDATSDMIDEILLSDFGIDAGSMVDG